MNFSNGKEWNPKKNKERSIIRSLLKDKVESYIDKITRKKKKGLFG